MLQCTEDVFSVLYCQIWLNLLEIFLIGGEGGRGDLNACSEGVIVFQPYLNHLERDFFPNEAHKIHA
jgi:hypothetical protein